jgi:hypothetical protein
MASRLLPLLLTVLAALPACGPVAATSRVVDARAEVEAALAAGADTWAPYEYTKAQIYLRKAKELEGRSDYQQSMVFAGEAEEMATRALEVAKKNKAKAERLKGRAQGTEGQPTTAPQPVKKKVIEVQGAPLQLSPGGTR